MTKKRMKSWCPQAIARRLDEAADDLGLVVAFEQAFHTRAPKFKLSDPLYRSLVRAKKALMDVAKELRKVPADEKRQMLLSEEAKAYAAAERAALAQRRASKAFGRSMARLEKAGSNLEAGAKAATKEFKEYWAAKRAALPPVEEKAQ